MTHIYAETVRRRKPKQDPAERSCFGRGGTAEQSGVFAGLGSPQKRMLLWGSGGARERREEWPKGRFEQSGLCDDASPAAETERAKLIPPTRHILSAKGHATGSPESCAAISCLLTALCGYLQNAGAEVVTARLARGEAHLEFYGADEAFQMAVIGLLQLEKAAPEAVEVEVRP